MAYVYIHYKLTDNTIFYVGVSSIDDDYFNRSKSKKSRNKDWYNIVNENGFRTEIVIKNVPLEDVSRYPQENFFYFSFCIVYDTNLCEFFIAYFFFKKYIDR